MDVLKLADEPDLALVVGNSVKILVFSEKMFRYPTFRRATFNSADRIGIAFKNHRDSNSSEPYEHLLPEDDPDALRMLCAACHDRDDLIPAMLRSSSNVGPESPELKGLLEFAIAFDHYGCPDELKPAARIAIDQITQTGIHNSPAIMLQAVHLFNHEECFAEITDYISRYGQQAVTHAIKDLELCLAKREKSIYGEDSLIWTCPKT